jgi:hypothetical protein
MTEPATLIPITKRETRILAQLLLNATTDTVHQLTADVAESLLEKLRQAADRIDDVLGPFADREGG